MPETPQETVRSAFDRYRAEKLDRLRSGKHVVGALARIVEAHGDMPLKALTRREILEVHGSLLSSGWSVAANRFLIRASTFLRWAHYAGLVDHNAAAGLIRSRRVPEGSRERTLTDAEIKAIWRHTNDGSPFARLVRLLLLSGQRRNEVARMRSDWIGEDGWITVPASEYKTNKGHRWFATELARAQLPDPLPDGRIFPSMSYDRHKKPLDKACGVVGWTLHDLRRTLATRMMAAGERSEVVEAVLGHQIGGGGIRAVYQRFDYVEERRAAMIRWSAEVERIAG